MAREDWRGGTMTGGGRVRGGGAWAGSAGWTFAKAAEDWRGGMAMADDWRGGMTTGAAGGAGAEAEATAGVDDWSIVDMGRGLPGMEDGGASMTTEKRFLSELSMPLFLRAVCSLLIEVDDAERGVGAPPKLEGGREEAGEGPVATAVVKGAASMLELGEGEIRCWLGEGDTRIWLGDGRGRGDGLACCCDTCGCCCCCC